MLTPSVALNRIQPSATSRPPSSQSNSSSTATISSIASKAKTSAVSSPKTPLSSNGSSTTTTGSASSSASNISTTANANGGQVNLKRTPSKQETKVSGASGGGNTLSSVPIASPPPLVRSDSNSSLKSSTSSTSNASLNTMASKRNDEKETLEKQLKDLQTRLELEKQNMDRLIAEKELEMRSYISGHQDTAEDIRSELLKLEKTKSDHEKTVEKLTREKIELEKNIDKLKSELNRTLATLQTAQVENDTLRNELTSMRERNVSQIEVLTNDLKSTHQQITQLQSEKIQLENRVRSLQTELLNQLSAETDQEKINDLENTISLLENEKKTLKAQIEKLQGTFKEEIKNLSNERDELTKELVFSNNQITLNLDEIEKVKHKNTLLEQDLFNSRQESSSMIDLLKAEIRIKSEQIESLNNELISLRTMSLEGEDKSNEISSLLSSVRGLTLENNTLKQQLEEYKEKNLDLINQLELKEEMIQEEKSAVQRLNKTIEELKATLKEMEGSLKIEVNLKEQLAFTLSTEQKSREMTEASARESTRIISDLEEKLSQETNSKQYLIDSYEDQIAQLQKDIENLNLAKTESEAQVLKSQSENKVLKQQLLQEIERTTLLKNNNEKSEEKILFLEQTLKRELESKSHNEDLLKTEIATLNESLTRERSTVESLRNSLVTEVSAQKVLSEKIVDLEVALSTEERERMNAIKKVDDMIIENERLLNHISENEKKMHYLEELVNQEKSSASSKEVEIRGVLEKRIQELELHSLSLNNDISKLKEAAQSEKDQRMQSEKTLKDDFQKQKRMLESKINELSATKEQLELLLSSEREKLVALDHSSKREIKKLQASLLGEKDFIITLEKRLKEEQDKNAELVKRLEEYQSTRTVSTGASNLNDESRSNKGVEKDEASTDKKDQEEITVTSPQNTKDKAVGGVSLMMGVFGLGVGVILPTLLRKYELLPSSFGL